MPLSHFDERSGAVSCPTPWGRWWQTVGEVFVEIEVPKGTRGKDVRIQITPRHISCAVHSKELFCGNLHRTVVADESTWTIEERQRVLILLVKTEPANSEKVWESLLDGQYAPDPQIMHEMMKKLDLEKFQIENPGFDFSGAKLDKAYDRIPGLHDGTLESQAMGLHLEQAKDESAARLDSKAGSFSL
ncbi:nudC domain-containing protein 2-like [Dermacentor andersoni]|uniref:nudC domain-containing protein 2-like n=1 Tax=Dermacentor andersoni TaxID=34620 RepID=UPI002155446D|nr:nudC domain-containing protein 2-like [Dermacentor andersoni]XP_050051207.1 nudC domain-containing protein 2-like [Dermacentor andersoni]